MLVRGQSGGTDRMNLDQLRLRGLRNLVYLTFIALACLATPAFGQPAPDTGVPRCILIDFATSKVLFEKNADQLTAPASLA